jgi:hypothetical protein
VKRADQTDDDRRVGHSQLAPDRNAGVWTGIAAGPTRRRHPARRAIGECAPDQVRGPAHEPRTRPAQKPLVKPAKYPGGARVKSQERAYCVAAGDYERHTEQRAQQQQGHAATEAGPLHDNQLWPLAAGELQQAQGRTKLAIPLKAILLRVERLEQNPDPLALDVLVTLRRETQDPSCFTPRPHRPTFYGIASSRDSTRAAGPHGLGRRRAGRMPEKPGRCTPACSAILAPGTR